MSACETTSNISYPPLSLHTCADISYATIQSAASYSAVVKGSLDFLCFNLPFAEDGANLLQVPVAGSALVAAYHISSLEQQNKTLILDGETLALIFAGNITAWDDPAIQDLNPNVTLPHANITIGLSPGQLTGVTDVFKRALSLFSAHFASELAKAGNDFMNMTPVQQGWGILQANSTERMNFVLVTTTTTASSHVASVLENHNGFIC